MKNAVALKGGSKQSADITTILKDPSQRGRLQNYIDEAVRCKIKIADEQESIKGLREAAIDDLNIEPKMFNTLVTLFFNNNFEQKKAEIEKIEAAINALGIIQPSISDE